MIMGPYLRGLLGKAELYLTKWGKNMFASRVTDLRRALN